MAVLFISHELLSIASLCRRVAILEKGELVESGSVEQIFCSPEHPYTRALVGTLPLGLPVFSSTNGTQKSRTRIFKAHLRTSTHGWRAPG
jgi:ABC-type dipeptide/oligopeptide/nickel transport system ATPase component